MAAQKKGDSWHIKKKDGTLGVKKYKSQAAANKVHARMKGNKPGKAKPKGGKAKPKSSSNKGGSKTANNGIGKTWMPVTKDGKVKAFTAGLEGGLAAAIFDKEQGPSPASHFANGNVSAGLKWTIRNLQQKGHPSRKVLAAGVGASLLLRLFGKQSVGPVSR